MKRLIAQGYRAGIKAMPKCPGVTMVVSIEHRVILENSSAKADAKIIMLLGVGEGENRTTTTNEWRVER